MSRGDANEQLPAANRPPFFHVIDIAHRRRRAFCRGERLFIHLYVPGAHRARIIVRDPRGQELPGSVDRSLTDDGELLISMSVPTTCQPGHYRIDVALDSDMQVYEKIVVSN